MKKLQSLLPLVAVVAAVVFSAFTTPSMPAPKPYEDQLFWFDMSGNYTGNHLTKSEEIAAGECKDLVTTLCERGYGPEDFNVIGNPQSGLKSTAQVNEVIRKTYE